LPAGMTWLARRHHVAASQNSPGGSRWLGLSHRPVPGKHRCPARKSRRDHRPISQRRPIRFSISLLRPAIGSPYGTRPTFRTHAVKWT
jgi:hypothetical protein